MFSDFDEKSEGVRGSDYPPECNTCIVEEARVC